jgi:hypothetical protein
MGKEADEHILQSCHRNQEVQHILRNTASLQPWLPKKGMQPWLAGSICEVMGEGPTHKAPLKQELAIS